VIRRRFIQKGFIMKAILSLRPIRTAAPLLAAFAILTGCESTSTAPSAPPPPAGDFKAVAPADKAKPQKGMDRVGSEAGPAN
jgi:hypothetical protein